MFQRPSDVPPLFLYACMEPEHTYTETQVFQTILTAFLGSGVLLLPQHMSELGFVLGPLVYALTVFLIMYFGRCLDFSISFVLNTEGVEVTRMTQLARFAGGPWGERVCVVCNVSALVGFSIMNLLLNGKNLDKIGELLMDGPLPFTNSWLTGPKCFNILCFPGWFLLLKFGTSPASLLVLTKLSGLASLVLLGLLTVMAGAQIWEDPWPRPGFSVMPKATTAWEFFNAFLNLSLTVLFFFAFLVPLPGLRRNMIAPKKFVRTFSNALLVTIACYIFFFFMGFYVIGDMPKNTSLIDLVRPDHPLWLQVLANFLFVLMTVSLAVVFMQTVMLTVFKTPTIKSWQILVFLAGLHVVILSVDQIKLVINVCSALFCVSNCIFIPASTYFFFKFRQTTKNENVSWNNLEIGFLGLLVCFGVLLAGYGLSDGISGITEQLR